MKISERSLLLKYFGTMLLLFSIIGFLLFTTIERTNVDQKTIITTVVMAATMKHRVLKVFHPLRREEKPELSLTTVQ